MDIIDFATFKFGSEFASEFTVWPTRDNPDVPFRFNSFFLEIDQEMTVIERQTYSALELVGDVGGLVDGLYYLMALFVAPVSTMVRRTQIIEPIFGEGLGSI